MSGPTGPRFGRQADLYRKLRPDYPESVFERIARACGEPRGVVVDLGAGSGQATTRLLEYFDRVIAVEPDADMAAHIPASDRLEFRVQPAEAAVFDQPVDAMTAATSFHWMDAEAVCAMAKRSLRFGGIFAPFGYGPFDYGTETAAGQVVTREYAEVWRAYMDPRLVTWRSYADIIRDTGLATWVEPFDQVFERSFSPDDAAGLMLTTSYATTVSRERPGYAEDFTRRVVEAADGQPVTVRFDLMGAVARF